MDRVLRILDANLNRAGEAIRVVEEAARFLLEDRALVRAVKEMRHRLSKGARVAIPASGRFAARDVAGDVGRTLRVGAQRDRRDVAEVVEANFKRLQEALRCIEEYGRGHPTLSRVAGSLRMESYGLESKVVSALGPRRVLREARLYVILTAEVAGTSLGEAARRALEGGAQLLQVREKTMSDRGLVSAVRRVLALARPRGVPVLVDDRVDVALASGADGVHIGDDDLSIADARRLLGPSAILGATAHSAAEARRAEREGADYVSAGPIFSTATKWRHLTAEAAPRLDPRGVSIVRSIQRAVSCPVFAIGGITVENLPRVIAAGARRVAVCAGVLAAADPVRATQRMRRALTRPVPSPLRAAPGLGRTARVRATTGSRRRTPAALRTTTA
ncbi:MAG: thiamine phosphate synthase [Planctomycetota bacterium]